MGNTPFYSTPLAIDLNDAAVAVANEAGLLHVEPAYVVVADGPARFGADALPVLKRWPRLTSVRYWQDLTAAPLPRPLRAFQSNAEIVAAHLQRLWLRHGTSSQGGLVCATPPWWTAEQVSTLISITREYELTILGLVDAAVAACATSIPVVSCCRSTPACTRLTLTQIRQAGQAQHRRPGVLSDARCRVAAATGHGTARTALRRVQPFRSAAQCRDRAGAVRPLAGLAGDGWPAMSMRGWSSSQAQRPVPRDPAGRRFQRTHGRGLRAAVADACGHGSLSGARTSLQVPHGWLTFPGVLESLMRLPDMRDPCAGTGRCRTRCPESRAMPERVPEPVVRTELAWDRPPARSSRSQRAVPAEGSERAATHLLAGAPRLPARGRTVPHRYRRHGRTKRVWCSMPACAGCPVSTARCVPRTAR